jgi:hypothetical protein
MVLGGGRLRQKLRLGWGRERSMNKVGRKKNE